MRLAIIILTLFFGFNANAQFDFAANLNLSQGIYQTTFTPVLNVHYDYGQVQSGVELGRNFNLYSKDRFDECGCPVYQRSQGTYSRIYAQFKILEIEEKVNVMLFNDLEYFEVKAENLNMGLGVTYKLDDSEIRLMAKQPMQGNGKFLISFFIR